MHGESLKCFLFVSVFGYSIEAVGGRFLSVSASCHRLEASAAACPLAVGHTMFGAFKTDKQTELLSVLITNSR